MARKLALLSWWRRLLLTAWRHEIKARKAAARLETTEELHAVAVPNDWHRIPKSE